MGALESLCRAVGYGGWGTVLLGVLCVLMAMGYGGRRGCLRLTVPVGDQREQIRRSRPCPPPRTGVRNGPQGLGAGGRDLRNMGR